MQFLASASSDGNISQSETTLFSKEFTKTIMADTVPIVISGNLDLSAELQGNIAAAVDMETLTESSITVSAGVEYEDGEFTYIDDAETTYKFKVTGDTGASIAGELRLIPDINISFYRVAAAEITLEPYVFSESTLEGEFKAMVDNNFADATANYRFSEFSAGVAMDAAIAAKFGIILDDRTIGAEDEWDNSGNPIFDPGYLVSLPSAEISTLSAASPTNGLLLGLETISGILGFADNRVINGYWQVYPDDSSVTFSANGDNVHFDYSTDAEYELRYVFYSELGSFIRQYQSLEVNLSDEDGDGLNNQYENFYSFLSPNDSSDATQDQDGDGYSNLDEYLYGSDPSSSSSQPNFLPTDFTAAAASEQVTLSWTRYANSTVYNIYRSDNPSCDLVNISSCSTASGQSELFSNASSPFVDDGLTNETTYYYWIEAIQDGITQLAEDYISATPQENTTTFTLNDTGIDWGGDYEYGNNRDCSSNISAPQDCHQGRDYTHNDDSDGHAGFSFTKLDSNGNNLAASATNWSCVRDNVTGLIWEVKTDDGGLHDKDDQYNWYNTDPATNGGFDGYADDDGNICYGYDSSDASTYCNTQAFTARVNAVGLCGFTDWRVPDIEELRSIVNYSRTNPSIDINYFPNTRSSSYWSASPDADGSDYAWRLYFYYGYDFDLDRSYGYHVRLVRSGQ